MFDISCKFLLFMQCMKHMQCNIFNFQIFILVLCSYVRFIQNFNLSILLKKKINCATPGSTVEPPLKNSSKRKRRHQPACAAHSIYFFCLSFKLFSFVLSLFLFYYFFPAGLIILVIHFFHIFFSYFLQVFYFLNFPGTFLFL